jgi:hypothetical protein
VERVKGNDRPGGALGGASMLLTNINRLSKLETTLFPNV